MLKSKVNRSGALYQDRSDGLTGLAELTISTKTLKCLTMYVYVSNAEAL